ncbi:MAG: O-methyltransferase [Verrucomicrobiia bacterium]
MSAGSLPYHLRPNKAVERLLFVDLLERLDEAIHFEQKHYEYIGLGGPQMEDFRVLNECFQDVQMISLERDPQVLKRQKFNLPHTNVKLLPQSSEEFIMHFEPQAKLIAWLDYAEEDERVEQIAEFQTLLRNIPELSIVKLTLNANPENLGGTPKVGLMAERRAKLLDQFGRFLPANLPEDAVSESKFPRTLLQIVAASSREALSGRHDWIFQSLSAFYYRDGQQMFTATGIAGPKTAVEAVVKEARVKRWHFQNLDWSPPMNISVPELTAKERIHINQLLPKCRDDLAAIHRKLGFQLDPKLSKSKAKLRQYVTFYRHYPHFGRVAF